MSTDAKDCTARVGDLDEKQKQTLRDWERKFMGKYKVVGALQGAAWDTGEHAPFGLPTSDAVRVTMTVALLRLAHVGSEPQRQRCAERTLADCCLVCVRTRATASAKTRGQMQVW